MRPPSHSFACWLAWPRLGTVFKKAWSLIGIGFSLAVIALASVNLVMDFDFIERGAGLRALK